MSVRVNTLKEEPVHVAAPVTQPTPHTQAHPVTHAQVAALKPLKSHEAVHLNRVKNLEQLDKTLKDLNKRRSTQRF